MKYLLALGTMGLAAGCGTDLPIEPPAERQGTAPAIPTTLAQCWAVLDRDLGEDSKAALRSAEHPSEFHMGLGRRIRNEWGLWTGSPLREAVLEEFPLVEADSMSGLIIGSYMAYLRNPEFTPEEYFAEYRRWDEERLANQPADDPEGPRGRENPKLKRVPRREKAEDK